MSLLQKRQQCRKSNFRISTKSLNASQFDDWRSFMDVQKSARYDDIITMNIDSCNLAEIPQLPPALQVLVIDLSNVWSLDNLTLPSSLRVIKISRSKLSVFPKIEHLWGLETIDLHDCYLERLCDNFPPDLRTADLSFNRIRHVDWSCLNEGLTALDLSFNFLSLPPPNDIKVKIQCGNNDFDYKFAIQRNIGINIKVKDDTDIDENGESDTNNASSKKDGGGIGVYDNSENVHFISIQQSAADSLAIIMKLCPNKKVNKKFKEEIKATYEIGTCCGKHPDSRYEVPPIDEWCADMMAYTHHGVTYQALLERVWTFIKSRWRQHQLIEVMKQELDSSIGLCMTGAFTRTISILSGFVDGVHIGISDNERLQERVAAIVARNRSKYAQHDIFVRMTKLDVHEVLAEMKVPLNQCEAWIEAIE